MKEIVADRALIARCGLYCGACGSYLKGRCPGCERNEKARWCKVRSCCLEGRLASCADCQTHLDPRSCKKYNNFISRVIGFVLRSNRAACLEAIRAGGYEAFAARMARDKAQTLRR